MPWRSATEPAVAAGRWRRVGVVTLLAAAIGGSPAAQGTPAAPAAAEWRQFRGSPQLTGVSESPLAETLTLRWTYQADDVIDSSAAIVGDTVYVSAGDGQLLALDLASGRRRWSYTGGTLVGESSPAVSTDRVFFGDLDGILHAVNRRDGSRAWTFKTEGEIRSSPVVIGDLVIVGSYDTHLYGFDAATGRLRWKAQTGDQVHATPSILGDLAFVAGCDMVFRAINVKTGQQAYTIDIGSYTAASPVVSGQHAYFGTFDNEVLALDLAARTIVWRFSDPVRQFPYFASAALGRDRVFVGGRDRMLRALDRATGKELWAFAARARIDSSPVLAGGRVFFGSHDNRLYAVDAATGERRWEFNTGATVTASPAVAAGRLVIGTHDGTIYCFG